CDLPAQLGASGEEALLVGREHPRQGRLALDDLEHGLLLTEQVLVGPRHDRDRALPAYAGSLKLLDGPGHSLALAPEAAFDADERRLGADREAGDDQPFDELVRVGPHQGAVFEVARLALGP